MVSQSPPPPNRHPPAPRRRSPTSADPLPFVPPPPAPRRSLADRLLRSTYLFPAGAAAGPTPIDRGWIIIRPTARGGRVRFRGDPTAAAEPRAPGMTPRERRGAWYDAGDYDRFKRQAAREAGVGAVRAGPDGAGRFAMAGDFDGAPAGGSRHNENEYGGRAGGGACRRGLGYHFSRSRRGSRRAARSSVVGWQRILRERAAPPSRSDGGARRRPRPDDGAEERRDEYRTMLALVSARCSRVAREEARWRGNVDYRVAYPERSGRHGGSGGPASSGGDGGVGAKAGGTNPKKRSAGDGSAAGAVPVDASAPTASPSAGAAAAAATGCAKRQRRSGCYGREDLSPSAIGYLKSGVLRHAEV